MATVNIKDAAGGTVAVEAPLAPGRAAAAASRPVTLSTEDKAALDGMSGKLPSSLGVKASAASLSVAEAAGSVTAVSGSITAGGTAQVLASANAARRGLTVQNTSSGDLRVSPWGTASSAAGYKVAAGQLLVLDAPHCGVGAVSIWGATTGQTYIGGEAA